MIQRQAARALTRRGLVERRRSEVGARQQGAERAPGAAAGPPARLRGPSSRVGERHRQRSIRATPPPPLGPASRKHLHPGARPRPWGSPGRCGPAWRSAARSYCRRGRCHDAALRSPALGVGPAPSYEKIQEPAAWRAGKNEHGQRSQHIMTLTATGRPKKRGARERQCSRARRVDHSRKDHHRTTLSPVRDSVRASQSEGDQQPCNAEQRRECCHTTLLYWPPRLRLCTDSPCTPAPSRPTFSVTLFVSQRAVNERHDFHLPNVHPRLTSRHYAETGGRHQRRRAHL